MDLDLLIPIAGMATAVVLFLPIVRSVVRITEKKLTSGADNDSLLDMREELRAVQDRLERLEHEDDRIAELEERLDFTERMLTQQQNPRIDGGHGS